MENNDYLKDPYYRISDIDGKIQFLAREFRDEGNDKAISTLIEEIRITLDDIDQGRF